MSDTVQSKLVAFCEQHDDLNLFAPSASQLKSTDDVVKFCGTLKRLCAGDTDRLRVIENYLKSADYSHVKTRVAELEKENAALKAENDTLKARPADAVKKVAPAPVDSKELEGLKKANKDLLAKNATLEADIATLKARPAAIGKKTADALVDSEEMKALKAENKDLLDKVTKAMDEIDKQKKRGDKWYNRAVAVQRKYKLLKPDANPKEKATKPTGKDKATPAKSAADVLVGGGKKEKPTKPTEAEKAAEKEAKRIARNKKAAETRQKKAEEAKKAQAAKLEKETSGEDEESTESMNKETKPTSSKEPKPASKEPKSATRKRKISSVTSTPEATPTPEASDADFSDADFSDESDHAKRN